MADQITEGPWLQYLGATEQTIVGTIGEALGAAGNVWSRQLKAMAEVFSRNLGNPGDLLETHRRVGEMAQQAVTRSYDQLVTAREGWAGRQHYRPGASDWHKRRFAGGVLRRALSDPDFIEATAQGINFANVDMLNRKAAQWHRLAFGAGGAGEGSSERVQVVWNDVVVATFGFDEPASPGFVLPRGVWVGPEGPVRSGAFGSGSDMFFPLGEARDAGLARFATRRPRATKGIQAHHFLEAGIRTMGNELPRAYEGLYRKWWNQGQSGPLGQVSSVVPARPYALGGFFGSRSL